MKFATVLKNAADTIKVQSQLIAILPELNSGKKYECEIKPFREKRSVDANAYFHVLVNKIAEKLKLGNDECKINLNLEYGTPAMDSNGNYVIIKIPADTNIKQFYEYAKWYGEREEKGLKLSYYIFYKRTHELDSAEMARLIDGVVHEAQQLGIETKTPAELAQLKSLWGQTKKEKENE